MNSALYERVYELVALIPEGRVVTYGQIARSLGQPRAARAVGWAMRRCPEGLPWHRVVNSRGRVSSGREMRDVAYQRALLEDEGIEFDLQGCIDLSVHGWDGI